MGRTEKRGMDMGFLDEIKAWTRYRMQIGMGLFHSPDDNEFLVEGAQLFCINGYGVTSLKSRVYRR